MELNTRKWQKPTGIPLDDFMKLVHEDSAGKHDYNVKSSQLRMDTKGKLVTKMFEDGEGFNLEFEDIGFNQMCQKIEVKELYPYGQKLYEAGQTARLSSLFNYHLEDYNQKGDKDWWIRSKNDKCRAVMTERYGIYDNDFIADTIYQNFRDKNIDIVGHSLSDYYMNCRIRLLDNVFNVGKNGKDDPLYMAIHIMNSEIGLSSVNMFLVVYRQVCTNGLIREESNMVFRQKHLGNGTENLEEISERLSRAFEIAQTQGKGMLEEFAETQEEKIEMPMENIRYLSRSQGYSQKFTESVEQNYLEEKDDTRFGLINSFTAAARDMNFEDRIQVERFAGNLIYSNLLK